MSNYMSSQVDLIKERLSISEVISAYIKIDKSGANFKARCPFHNEKTPSFFVSPSRNTFYCFGCGVKGDIFSFVEQYEAVDFMGALKILAAKAGVELVKENKDERQKRDRLRECLETATLFFMRNLHEKSEHTHALQYLLERGLSVETIRHWRIGYASAEWRLLRSHLAEKEYTDEEMEAVGLIKAKEESTKGDYYDRFRSRIIFPITDTSGRVVGFSGRIFPQDNDTAKYLNSPETKFYNKSQVLFGFSEAKQAMRKSDRAIIVEGQMDILMSHQQGFVNTVAVSGTALTETQLETIRRFTNNITFAFDPDNAGMNAALRSARIALAMGMDVKVARLPKGEDPALLILHKPEEWKHALQKAEHIVNFTLNVILDATADERTKIKKIKEVVLPLVAGIESSMERSHFAREIAHKAGLKEDSVWKDIETVQKNTSTETKSTSADIPKVEVKDNLERRVFSVLFYLEDPSDPPREMNEYLNRLSLIRGGQYLKERAAEFEPFRNEMILEAEILYSQSKSGKKDLDELLSRYEEDHLKVEFAKALRALQEAEKDKNTDQAAHYLNRCKELGERLRTIKQ
jgi:DNA primase